MTQLEKDTDELSAKVSAAIRDTSGIELLRWFETYGQRATELLHPTPKASGNEDDQAEDRIVALRRYANCSRVVAFCQTHKLTLGHHEFWWYLSEIRPGHLLGFETDAEGAIVRGIAKITNGIDIWIERDNGTLFKAHREWWRYDRKPKNGADTPRSKTQRERMTIPNMEAFTID